MISIIAAIQKSDRGLGFQNELLFKISEDMKRLKELTTGNSIIMGRKTFESIGRPLPNRFNIVVTRNADFTSEGIEIASSLEDAINIAKKHGEKIFIFGGGEIYNQALPFTDRLYLTLVEGNKPADTFFPDYSDFKKVIEESEIKTDEKSGAEYQYVTLEK